MISVDFLDYSVFIGLVVFSMIVDFYLHREDKEITLSSAVKWSIFWVVISFVYAGFLWYHHNFELASLFVSGYLLEKVLSVDNLFVFSAIFAWFTVPNNLRHRVLYWGVIGAIIFRLIFVLIGSSLLLFFGPYAEILFGILILIAAYGMIKSNDKGDEEEADFSNHLAYKIGKKLFPVKAEFSGNKFFVRLANPTGKKVLFATPLFLCVLVVELSDVMFAFDSVPAVIAISKEPLIIYSSMIFAILGLRTLYFVLESLKEMLHNLEKAIIFLLFFIGIKMIISSISHLSGIEADISPIWSLGVVIVTLTIGVVSSLFNKTNTN